LHEEWRPADLEFKYGPVCSQAQKEQLLEAGVPLKDAPVIYEGINLPPHLEQAANRNFSRKKSKISLLYVGILAPHKGVHTAIEAFAHLPRRDRERFQLTILGTGLPTYEERLRSMVQENQLDDFVSFHEPIPRETLPEFLGQHDVLLLPSIWEEPLALIMQEGLASGMVVIGSSTGGTQEIIIDNENGLRFEAEDHAALAKHLQRIILEPALLTRLSKAGRKTAAEKFDIVRMVDEIEAYLHKVIKAENAPDFSH
jgi:glycosyltransferase involved in cell wall biosynthesis